MAALAGWFLRPASGLSAPGVRPLPAGGVYQAGGSAVRPRSPGTAWTRKTTGVPAESVRDTRGLMWMVGCVA
jgi:hypothetical protein